MTTAFTGHAAEYAGVVRGQDGPPLAGVYLGLMAADFSPLASETTSAQGTFSLDSGAGSAAYLFVQPPADTTDDPAIRGFHWQPRIFVLDAPQSDLEISLPPAFTLAIQAYSADGTLMRWHDFEALGKYGGQFLYATQRDTNAAQPATIWPVFGPLAGKDGGPREEGLPALVFAPDTPVDVIQPMFWPVPGYGKLLLEAALPDASQATRLQGGAATLLLNLALARTELRKLEAYRGVSTEGDAAIALFGDEFRAAEALPNPKAQAAAADVVLAKMLRLRDDLAFEAAQATIPQVRKGTVEVALHLPEDADATDYTIHLEQTRRDFLFGVYEGSPYNATAWKIAREAGFDMATVLLGWDWTKNPARRARDIDAVYGLSALEKLGYTIKAHGAVWLQGYGILPAEAMGMPHDELAQRALAQQQALLRTFGDTIDIWEAMNEPAATNTVGMPRAQVMALMQAAAINIAEADPSPTLVNSPHELSYGAKNFLHKIDGTPADGYPLTYTDFLLRADAAGALANIDTIGIQIYPGFHLNADFENLQGPAMTPADIAELLARYARFNRPIHITEFSVPSAYAEGATNGWWREPWNEAVQAEYTARVYTLLFANPRVQSMGWWDISDAKPAVRHGGLLHADDSPKPVFEALTALLASWRTDETLTPDADGQMETQAFGGELMVTVTGPTGVIAETSFDLWPGWTRKVEIDLHEGSTNGAN